jgi:hypothetical protein
MLDQYLDNGRAVAPSPQLRLFHKRWQGAVGGFQRSRNDALGVYTSQSVPTSRHSFNPLRFFS